MKKKNEYVGIGDFRLEDHQLTFEQELILKIYTYVGSACIIMLMVMIALGRI